MFINEKKRVFFNVVPLLLYAVIIFPLSSFQSSYTASAYIYGFDKLIHLVEYFVLGYLMMRYFTSLMSVDIIKKHALMATVVTGTLYGISDEWHQSFVPGRSASVYDVVADAAGVILAVVMYRKISMGCGLIKKIESWLDRIG